MTEALPLLLALLAGALAGFAVRRARLCSMGALEALWLSGDALRLRAFALALGIAVLGTQAMVAAGLLDLAGARLLPGALPWAGDLAGGLVFGLGMALVGTCPFGALMRLGGGDLRAGVVLLVVGLAAAAASTGLLAGPTGVLVGWGAVPLAAPDLPGLLGGAPRLAVAGVVAAGLLAWALADRRLRRAPRLLAAGLGLGGAVLLGWVATGPATDPFGAEVRPPTSLSFIGPLARLLVGLAVEPRALLGFGAAAVLGALLGAAAAALLAREVRWEAFDDGREMQRHLAGAALMGIGGTWAAGCTIGQGLSAGSVLSPTWLVSVPAIALGARLGLGLLLGGGARLLGRGV